MPASTSTARILARLAEPQVLFPAVGAVLLAVIWGSVASLIRVDREATLRSATASSRELADTYEAQVVRAVREIDQVLKLVQLAHDAGRIDLPDLRSRGLLPPEILFTVSLVDGDDRVVASTRLADVGTVIPVAANDGGGDALTIGTPQRRLAGDWILAFSRPLRGGSGARPGAAVVTVDAAYFTAGYETARLGSRGLLAVVGRDGIVRSRRVGDVATQGEGAATLPPGAAAGPDAPPRLVTTAFDGERRIVSARELFEHPLTVVVGLSEEEALAPAVDRAWTYAARAAAGSALLVLVLVLLGRVAWRHARARANAHRALRDEIAVRREAESALRLRHLAIESSVNAIVITRASSAGRAIEYVNPAFERITGYPASEAIGRDPAGLFGGERTQAGGLLIEHAVRERREAHAVVKSHRRDGTTFWNDHYVAPVRGEDGAVTHFVEVLNDVTEAKEYEAELARQAHFDSLTGLANRNLLHDRLQQAIAAARRDERAVAAVFLDLDHFKLVNDSLGHAVGDELLRAVAARLAACVRDSDTVARYGGDEFVLVLPMKRSDTLEARVTALMQKLLAAVAAPLELGGRAYRPACSIGVSVFPQDGDDADDLLRNADAAMYRAKETGRNRFQAFTADVHERISHRIELESALRRALERGEFELHYQPQVGLGDGTLVGMEALLRWRHPARGLVPPGEFIGFAEQTGLIVPIGTWVLREACRQNREWQRQGFGPLPVSVNMSALQCEQPDVDQVVRRALADAGLEARYLELEITESISMANPALSVPLMRRLKEIGVTLSIDDFGTGFSNLSYLRRFPVDRLKIDLSFVREIATDPGTLAISEAIITMSHSLNLEVVAEGVETLDQLCLLQARACDSFQGYYFSPPLDAAKMGAVLRDGLHVDRLRALARAPA